MMQIAYDKADKDLWLTDDANEIKHVVNANAEDLLALTTSSLGRPDDPPALNGTLWSAVNLLMANLSSTRTSL